MLPNFITAGLNQLNQIGLYALYYAVIFPLRCFRRRSIPLPPLAISYLFKRDIPILQITLFMFELGLNFVCATVSNYKCSLLITY